MAAETQGNASPQDAQGTGASSSADDTSNTTAKPMTADEVNRAITARFAAFEKRIGTQVDQSIGGLKGTLDELKAALMKPKSDDSGAGDEAGDSSAQMQAKKPGAASGEPQQSMQSSAEIVALKRQMTELKNKLGAQEEALKQERKAALESRMRQKVTEALGAIGVAGSRAKHALGILVDVEKRIALDDATGSVFFKDENGDPLDLNDGLKAWSQTEDGKMYLPPRAPVGSGDRNNSGTSGNGSAPNDPKAALRKLVAEKFKLPA